MSTMARKPAGTRLSPLSKKASPGQAQPAADPYSTSTGYQQKPVAMPSYQGGGYTAPSSSLRPQPKPGSPPQHTMTAGVANKGTTSGHWPAGWNGDQVRPDPNDPKTIQQQWPDKVNPDQRPQPRVSGGREKRGQPLYPAHWYENKPTIVTHDHVPLPGGGHGSSTTASWIKKNMELDRQRGLPEWQGLNGEAGQPGPMPPPQHTSLPRPQTPQNVSATQVYIGEDGRAYYKNPAWPQEVADALNLRLRKRLGQKHGDFRPPFMAGQPPRLYKHQPPSLAGDTQVAPPVTGAPQVQDHAPDLPLLPGVDRLRGVTPFGVAEADGYGRPSGPEPPPFQAIWGDPFGGTSDEPLFAQRDAFINNINEQMIPYYTGQASGPPQFNLQQAWDQGGQMVQDGWQNPFAQMLGTLQTQSAPPVLPAMMGGQTMPQQMFPQTGFAPAPQSGPVYTDANVQRYYNEGPGLALSNAQKNLMESRIKWSHPAYQGYGF